jgi:hypothetical protein
MQHSIVHNPAAEVLTSGTSEEKTDASKTPVTKNLHSKTIAG